MDAGAGLASLLSLTQSPDILAGDFNIRHSLWDPAVCNDACGESLLTWATEKGLFLLNNYGESTHDAGSVLDLCFVKECFKANYKVRHDLDVGSDHRTLFFRILDGGPEDPNPGRLRYAAADWPAFYNILRVRLRNPQMPDVNEEATFLAEAISGALRAACPRSRKQSSGRRWWTEVCSEAHRNFCQIRRQGLHAVNACRKFAKTVKNAKRDYWRNKIDQVASLTEAYKITRWHKKQTVSPMPPLVGPHGPVATPEAKAQTFRQALLSRFSPQDDIPNNIPSVARKDLPWPPITEGRDISRMLSGLV